MNKLLKIPRCCTKKVDMVFCSDDEELWRFPERCGGSTELGFLITWVSNV